MQDIYGIRRRLSRSGLVYYSLAELEKQGYNISAMPFSIRVLLENVLRNYDGFAITKENAETLLNWAPQPPKKEIPFKPARVLMQDFTGVPAIVDITSIRAEVVRRGKDGKKVNPLVPVDLVIDHSVMIDYFGRPDALERNMELEYQRNGERYRFLKWAQKAFQNFSVVPPGMGICHQVNLEYLATGVTARDGLAFPDTLVGTDSHTPMVNGIGVIGWGVGGIEAEAALLGQPLFFVIPEVIGLRLTGRLREGVTATDLVLTITQLLRRYGVVEKFVEVFGPGLDHLTVPDRATISNMSPEFGCTVTFFPIDDRTLDYMRLTHRSEEQVSLVEEYCKANMLWRESEERVQYTQVLELDMDTVEATLAGPKRPQDRVPLTKLKETVSVALARDFGRINGRKTSEKARYNGHALQDGDVVIAAITSCTNTSNPTVMVGAGLVARKARSLGLTTKPWVKTSLAPGSRVVTDYLKRSGLLDDLEALRFHVAGYGCTTCIGNSGPLPEDISAAIDADQLVVSAVLSGNRNFEARVHPQVKMNFLASPMLVVAYALAGTMEIDLSSEPLGIGPNGQPVFLKDIWPTSAEIQEIVANAVTAEAFGRQYQRVFEGDERWQHLSAPEGNIFPWDPDSTYIAEAPFFKGLPEEPHPPCDILQARVLLCLGDSITTDHISPAGSFKENTPAGQYLLSRGVPKNEFNSYGSRRGHHEVMIRGTFANVRIKNKLASREGGYTRLLPEGEETTVYEAAMAYKQRNTPLLVLAGKEYGSGSSRDWAAKGTYLLGIKAIIAESFERIHRSNLVGMGVLPLQFLEGQNAETLGLTGLEVFDVYGISDGLTPGKRLTVKATKDDGHTTEFQVVCRLNSPIEIEYYRHGGILQYVLRQFLKN
ncbi:MAG: aconitate hydratase AcnA [Flavobacteriales bacterium]|nr:aconitate hydratase AcnA [Flavobacteriales bacterium]MCX7768090.1 aconitate hydratase AcnA [Flavobacteriales bacterium]MDW8410344.1 aconitate hydratase AcnA [Flavobacteriales bacterium]